ncbi:MAG: NAD(P)H-dependent oxidoreductase [Nannocystaceae bacterium]|nr:NAD(P)H-dependent oxidoreductase [Nannocystaceae bacterium]
MRLLAISGSLRARSTNTAALDAVAALAPAGTTVTRYPGLGELPHFNPDLDGEAAEPPPAVAALRAEVAAADALVICSPEYAHGVPGSLKNALDWLVSCTDFPGKVVALLVVSPSAVFVHAALRETLQTMSAQVLDDPRLIVAMPRNRLDTAAMLADDALARALAAAIEPIAAALASSR